MGSTIKNDVAPVQHKKDLASIFKYGDIYTKLSFVIFGLANMVNGQVIKGLIFLGLEIAYFIYMANNWRVAVGMVIVLIGVGVITDALTKNTIKEICEETF